MFIFVSINEAADYWAGHKRTLDAFTYTCLNAYLFIHYWVRTYSCMFECVLIPGLIHVWVRTYSCMFECVLIPGLIHVWMRAYSCMFECVLIPGLIHVWMRTYSYMFECVLIPGLIHGWMRTYSYMFECVLIPGLIHGWMRLGHKGSLDAFTDTCMRTYGFQTTGRVQGFVSVRPVNCFSFQPLLIHVWGLMDFRPQAVCRALCQLDQLIALVFSRLYEVDQCQRHVNWKIQVQTFCFFGDNGTDHHLSCSAVWSRCWAVSFPQILTRGAT